MLTLEVLGVEDGAIIAASPAGERFRIPVDAALKAKLEESGPAVPERRLSPREIQAHVRAGLSPQQVSALTGAPVAFIERFIGPVLAEREYVTESARAVRLPPEVEGGRPRTFGAIMAERLAALDATGVKWTSTKEAAGWVVALTFSADGVDHDARWRFDPKRMQLAPENVEAATLSQEGTPAALSPRLRAIEPTVPVTVVTPTGPAEIPATIEPAAPDMSRFDSAIFTFPDLKGQGQHREESPRTRRTGPTTDQLASLSRRRGQREPTVDTASLPVTKAMQIVDDEDDDPFVRRSPAERETPAPVTRGRFPERLPEPEAEAGPTGPQAAPKATPKPDDAAPMKRPRGRSGTRSSTGAPQRTTEDSGPVESGPSSRPRRGRTTMPSWDEIVFGRDED